MSLSTHIFTVRKRSLRRLCFYTCLSVIPFTGGGGGVGACAAGGVCLGPDPGRRLRGLAGGLSMPRSRGEVKGSGWGVSRPKPRVEVEGSGRGVSMPMPRGEVKGSGWGCLGPHPGERLGVWLGGGLGPNPGVS